MHEACGMLSSQTASQNVDLSAVNIIREIAIIISKLRTSADHDHYGLLFRRLDKILVDDLALSSWNSPVWSEFLSLAASGRILSATAEAGATSWFSSGAEYTQWLGRCLTSLLVANAEAPAIQVCHKALMLGYAENLISPLLSSNAAHLVVLVRALTGQDQRKIIYSVICCYEAMFRNSIVSANEIYGTIASLLSLPATGPILATWLTRDLQPAHIEVYRAIIGAIAATDSSLLWSVLERTWVSFGDKLEIKHSPVIQQEATTQILLLSAGYVHRQSPLNLLSLVRSSTHTAAISNRLSVSSPRIRFLGMVVGEIISLMVDKPDARLSFGESELHTAEYYWYRSLAVDNIVPEKELRSTSNAVNSSGQPIVTPKIAKNRENSKEDKDLVTYDKPEDPEDESEDPSLVQRNKSKTPRYIRDLVSGLNNSEDYETHRLAMTYAATLIRKKAKFGAELTDRCEELALVLLGVSDVFKIDQFQELRSAALISLTVAEPERMGRWYATNYFSGDYSISQRALILTALGMGARELAGFGSDEDGNLPSPPRGNSEAKFPSQVLPARFHRIYGPLDSVADHLQDSMIKPVATRVMTSLSASSILQVQKTRSRLSPGTNTISSVSAIIPSHFFFPLVGHWSSHLPSNFSSPYLLPLYLRTLAVLFISCKYSVLTLPRMTEEFWALVLSVRSQAQNEMAILDATLFCLLSILNVNSDRRQLAKCHARELIETHEWVGVMFAGLDGRDDESSKLRSLAASVLVETNEVLESQQRLLSSEFM